MGEHDHPAEGDRAEVGIFPRDADADALAGLSSLCERTAVVDWIPAQIPGSTFPSDSPVGLHLNAEDALSRDEGNEISFADHLPDVLRDTERMQHRPASGRGIVTQTLKQRFLAGTRTSGVDDRWEHCGHID
ncbi:MAG: hypothetical protein VYC95_02455 [Verrucomicrobiota bacterium]|nr:hypothetical protein [Verrucomicrobiota bacterium]